MRVFAIGDLHMPGGMDKPMGVFGAHWDDHITQISKAWLESITSEDIVLIPGDLSWAMHLDDAIKDLQIIHELPGTKLILRGNHDYWWTSISKLRSKIPSSFIALQNDSVKIGEFCFTGTRGWLCPGSASYTESTDGKIYRRELMRLELSLGKASDALRKICMLHFPPFSESNKTTGFTNLMEQYGVEQAVYAHLHGKSCVNTFNGMLNGVNYTLCSCDCIGFVPKLICESN